MSWDNAYKDSGNIWGERPSELAIAMAKYLRGHKTNDNMISILDIGCGYGRDALYFLGHFRCEILGIDGSEKAIDLAKKAAVSRKNMKFQCCDFTELGKDSYDVVFISNLYQLLRRSEREELRRTVMKVIKPNGLLFLSTLSISDPEHYGKGAPFSDESNSFMDKVFLHFCTRNELEKDFKFLTIGELYEHEYYEPRATGETHHHISWILIGEYVK